MVERCQILLHGRLGTGQNNSSWLQGQLDRIEYSDIPFEFCETLAQPYQRILNDVR